MKTLALVLAAVLLPAQQPLPTMPGVPFPQRPTPVAGQQAQEQTPAPRPPAPPAAGSAGFSLNLTGATLQEVIDILARQLKINYILDPQVRGVVTINTYGELDLPEVMPLLLTILRMNGATAVQVGNLYRIVPAKDAGRLPVRPQTEIRADLPEDERMMLNLVPLRYVTASDIAKVLTPFLGEGAQMMVLEAGNLLLLQDNSRSMRRTMELLALFDHDTFAKQRVRLYEIKNTQATPLAKELEAIFAAYALSEKSSAIRFLPLERISSLLAVSPNPNVFDEVKSWVEKLDQPVTIGGIQNFIYRVQYGLADQLAGTLMMLYGSYGQGQEWRPGGPGEGTGGMIRIPQAQASREPQPAGAGGGGPGGSTDRTGTFLGAQAPGQPRATGIGGSSVRIVPDAINNVIVVQATQQEWELIRKTLGQLDVPPRQVLIDAQIYEVTLNEAFSSGVSAYLRQRGSGLGGGLDTRKLVGGFAAGSFGLTIGHLIGSTRELVAFLDAQASTGRSKVISAPSVIATDNLAASINVGTEIPILTSQGLVAGAQAGGSSLFTNTVSNRNTGVILTITARVNATGIVTMMINQEVSSPQPVPAGAAIQSPSISKRQVQTQVTVDDGSTIAIGGIMQESDLYSTARLPLLGRIPILGAAFGSTSISKSKTELIILLTPHVIYDENQMKEVSQELRNRLKGLQKLMKE